MLVSMGDIAVLALVQRPVITMWRRRYATGAVPFPLPVHTEPLRFDAADVLAWLNETGRGNNPHPTAHLPALELRERGAPGKAGVAAVSALLSLRHHYGDSLLAALEEPGGPDRVRRTAGESQLGGAVLTDLSRGAELTALARVAEAFLDHQFGVGDAHDWLSENWFKQAWPELAATSLSDELASLLVSSVIALADTSATHAVLDASGNGHSWLPLLPSEWVGTVGVAENGALSRHTLRACLLSDRDAGPPGPRDAWDVVVDLALSGTQQEVLERLHLPKGEKSLVVGPARYLCEPVPHGLLRDEALRAGVVRAIVKLPAGLRPSNPREQLALWLLAEYDDHPFEQQRTFVADLSARELDTPLAADLVADLRAAALDATAHGHRNWRVLSAVRTAHLLARPGSLATPPPTARAVRVPPGEAVVDLRRRAEELGIGDVAVIRPSHVAGGASVTVELAGRRKWLTVKSGIRLDVAKLMAGELSVWSHEDGRLSRRSGVDRLQALTLRRAWLTQPGDVIYRGGGEAEIDHTGGAIVAYPVKALRLARDAPTTSWQLQRAIATAPPGSTERQWQFAPVAEGQRRGLSEFSARINERRTDLWAELQNLQNFEESLLDACENQLITLEVD